ncbi:MAG: hypothetical protein EXR11_04875 [Rhodospirillaceae bacterium]|nr:hypothetical protein [Rhodospirillaceae bacterium]
MTRFIAALSTTASAAEPAAAVAMEQKDVAKELRKLMNAYGAGEMSSKEYKARKQALMQDGQVASTTGK